jgi:viologen exporter family transport system permease protein
MRSDGCNRTEADPVWRSSGVRFLVRLLWFNLCAAMAYRVGFLTSVGFMVISDAMWIVFWTIFFSRFPVVRGWTLEDVVTLWAIAATGYGIAWGFFGNARPEGVRVIVSGRMDYYLLLPRNVLLHFIGGSVSVASFGDIIFGLAVFVGIVRPDPAQLGLFLILALCAATILVSFGVLMVSLTFWAGNTESLGLQISNALITFSTYPMDLFSTTVKVALFTVLPAGFAVYLPVTIIRDFDLVRLGIVFLFTGGFAAFAAAAFYAGLRRYESGNLVAAQG